MSRFHILGNMLLLVHRGSRVTGLPLPVAIEHHWQVRQQDSAPTTSCILNGNPDLYGLGIRLGVYFQLISTLLANHFLPDALREAWDSNTIFLISIFIAIIKSSVHANNLTAPEAFVMLQMLFAFLIAVYHVGASVKWVLFDPTNQVLYSTVDSSLRWTDVASELAQAHADISRLGTFLRQCLTLAISAYNVWFWFPGSGFLDFGRPCQSEMFLFSRLDLHGNAKIFFQVLSTFYLLYQAFRFCLYVGPWDYLAKLGEWKQKRFESDYRDTRPAFWRTFLIQIFDPRSENEKEKAEPVKEDVQWQVPIDDLNVRRAFS